MRSLILLLFMVASYGYADAQNFVSTTAENKNVVLEEFTGIYCTFCPDGHKRAQQIKDANPGDVVLINVHAGGYADPSGSDPDFRTTFGETLDNWGEAYGYPCGMVNRVHRSNASVPYMELTNQQGAFVDSSDYSMSRGYWQTMASQVLTQSSPVNVAAQASINVQTRELKVIVETYFTAAGGTAPYKLNVALMQNNVEGPQTGSSANPAQVLSNGNYNHNHVLRHLLGGQWGIDIDSTHMGYFQADTLTYTIPLGINYPAATNLPIAFELNDMELAAYVSSGQDDILTGNYASITQIIPPNAVYGSANIVPSNSTPTLCATSFSPGVILTNDDTSTLSNIEVSYTFNGGTPVSQIFTSSITPGQSATVTFPSITLASGGVANSFSYSIDISKYNSSLVNSKAAGDFVQEGSYVVLAPTANTTPISEGFQGLALGTPAPIGSIADNPLGIRAYSVNNTISSTVTWNLGGFGASNGCFRWDFYDIGSGQSSKLVFEKQDMSGFTDNKVAFAHAYAQYTNENDRLKVLASMDCGQTWTEIWNVAGVSLATAPVHGSAVGRFYPEITEWRADTATLPAAFDGATEVVIAFEGISAYGNSLYVDDINTFGTAIITGIKDTEVAQAALSIMPNPVHNEMTVQFDLPETAEVNMTIYNALGQQVQNVTTGTFEGTNTIQVNTSQMAAGVYLLNLASDKGLVTKRFTVEK